MSILNNEKNKLLYQQLPSSVVVPASWLDKHGISMQLRYKYVQSGWLQTMGKGAYIINPKNFTWEGLVVGIQHFAKLDYHIGGLKALELQGFAHYLPIGNESKITLYGKNYLPAWIKNLDVDIKVTLYKKPYFDSIGLKEFSSTVQGYDLKISSPERAIFELLYLIEKDGISFEFVSEIFEGLTTLRPNIVNALLLKCDSKKVKRLFLFFMENYNHQWTNFVNKENVDIGVGKMQIVKEGAFDKKYLITIPKSFKNESK